MEPNANVQANDQANDQPAEDVVLDDEALSVVSGGKGVIRNGFTLG